MRYEALTPFCICYFKKILENIVFADFSRYGFIDMVM